jgi:hypothetical protein
MPLPGQRARPKKKALQHVKRAQHTKGMFACLPSIKPKISSGISMIKVPVDKPDNPKEALVWNTITDATNVKTAILSQEKLPAILSQEKLHFNQAKDTPFAQAPLTNIFNWSATSPQAEHVLSRQFNPPYDITSKTDCLLQQCFRKLPEPSPEITLQAMKQKYQNWSKGTSTSPSGRHLGHKHALLRPCSLNPNSPELEHPNNLHKTIWRVHHGMLNFGLRKGYCFNRWKTVVTTLIEKDPGNPRIYRLRVIHLYDDCYNLLLRLTYCNALHRAEDCHSLNESNFGSQPCWSSLDPIGLEMLQTEYSSLTWLSHLKFSNDAATCFNCCPQHHHQALLQHTQ